MNTDLEDEELPGSRRTGESCVRDLPLRQGIRRRPAPMPDWILPRFGKHDGSPAFSLAQHIANGIGLGEQGG
jgi:hypothetical protein